MISLLVNSLQILDISLGISLSYLTIVFLIRLILTWYPKIDLSKGLWLLISIPSSYILNLTRKLIPPIGGISFLVKLRIELDGIEINNHTPFFKSIFGYQVRINLIKKTIVRYEREIPKLISKI